MIYAGILAAGVGNRMGNTTMPKQFLTIGTKPIVIHTLEKFMLNDEINKIFVIVSNDWKEYMQQLIFQHFGKSEIIEILVAEGDKDYHAMQICKYVKTNFGLKNDDILVLHDAVRPFITNRIIEENIRTAKKYTAVDTVIPAIDTIVESIPNKDNIITNIPVRDYMYQGQTPQSFKMAKFMTVYKKLTPKEKSMLTDACKIFVLKNEPVAIVIGENYNFKITNSYDLKIANAIVEGDIL